MARRRRDKTNTNTPKLLQRDLINIASNPSVLLQRALSPVLSPIAMTASLPDDWRTWEPEPRLRRPRTFSHSIPVTKPSRKATPYGYTQHFAAPDSVVMCVRRKTRREVILAKRLAAKGSKSRYRRRTEWSDIKC